VITVAAGVVLFLLVIWLGVAAAFGRALLALWNEPVLRTPVLILESDDWGPAPREHADLLREISALLAEYRDGYGSHPVMTLGVVLAIPRTQLPGNAGSLSEATLDEPFSRPLVDAMQAGVQAGVFDLQLHGHSHYWPDALLDAAKSDASVADWLRGPATWRTEDLPPGLQSRWAPEVRGKQFAIPSLVARSAAELEARAFHQLFGVAPAVAVPNTFVWNPDVEEGWATAGVRTVVTPGRYYLSRSQFSAPDLATIISNGMRSQHVRYVVRDQYFEPHKGHSASDGLAALAANTALGRPTLLEIHRINFLEPDLRARSLTAIRDLLRLALDQFPAIQFLTTRALAETMDANSPSLVSSSGARRVAVWCTRVSTLQRFWRYARISGLSFLITGLRLLALKAMQSRPRLETP
jgi:hypothetical protein